MDNNRIEGGGGPLLFSPAKRHLTQQFVPMLQTTKQMPSIAILALSALIFFWLIHFWPWRNNAFLEKSRKHNLRNLDVVGDSKMGCMGSDGEDELRISSSSTSSTKKSKFPKKFLDDCSTVCHVSVPRKLRSATKKRSRESISPPLPVCKKLNHAVDDVEVLKKDGSLKSKLKMKQGEAIGCVRDDTQGTVTKDEEEVAEALYALSGVFSSAVKTDKRRFTGQGIGTKAEDSVTPLDAEGKLDEEPNKVSSIDVAPNRSSNALGSAGDTFQFHCLNDTTEPHISISKRPSMGLSSDIPEVNFHLTAFIPGNQHTIQKATFDPVDSGASTELSKTRLQIANLPAWFESTSCSAQSPEFKRSVIANKDGEVGINSNNSWKRCSAHVYISRFIKVHQITQKKNTPPMQSTELTTIAAPKQGAHTSVVDLTGERNGLIGVVSSDSFIGFAPEKNVTEVRNAILLHKRLVQHQQQASTPYEGYTPENQSLDFSSLPAGSSQLETSNCISRPGNGLKVSMPLPFSWLLSQNHPPVPFQVPQNCFSSTSYTSHVSVSTVPKVQFPYVGSTSHGPTLTNATASSAQLLEQQQQRRSSLLMAHYKPGVAPPSVPSKETGGPDLPPVFQHAQTIFPPSLSSLEVLGPRYAPILQQQQQLNTANSLLHLPIVKGQYHHLPSVHEANLPGVRSDNVPLQITCNQYI